jgi:hypothetical protein
LGGNEGADGCGANADGVDELLLNEDVVCVGKAEIGCAGAKGDGLLDWEKTPADALPPGPKTDPVLVREPVDALPPGPNTDPVGLVPVDALPPGPKTDPVGFGFENTDLPKADPVDGCCTPNTEGCPNADVVLCAGAPKTDVVVLGVLPKDDC